MNVPTAAPIAAPTAPAAALSGLSPSATEITKSTNGPMIGILPATLASVLLPVVFNNALGNILPIPLPLILLLLSGDSLPRRLSNLDPFEVFPLITSSAILFLASVLAKSSFTGSVLKRFSISGPSAAISCFERLLTLSRSRFV